MLTISGSKNKSSLLFFRFLGDLLYTHIFNYEAAFFCVVETKTENHFINDCGRPGLGNKLIKYLYCHTSFFIFGNDLMKFKDVICILLIIVT